MKVFLLFSPCFVEWGLAIAAALKADDPACQIIGLVSGPPEIFERVARSGHVEAGDLQRLDRLERAWLESPVDPKQFEAAARRFGSDTIQRLLVADPCLGRGFVSGGLTPETALSRLTRDPAMLERYMVGLLGYVDEVLRDRGADLVFCHRVDDAPSLALALASRNLDIAFAQIRHTRIGARVIIDTSPFDDLEPVNDLFQRILLTNQFPADTKAAAETYLAAARGGEAAPDYLGYHKRRVRNEQSPARLLRMAASCLGRSLREIATPGLREVRSPSPLSYGALEIRSALRARALLSRGPFHKVGYRPNGTFAFFPLHVDPESSTMVQSPMHTDQLALAEAVAKSLPAGMTLLVKEHIPMLGRRPAGFYKRLTALPGVVLASPFEQGSALVCEAALTTVISSTAAWEAMLFGKPTVIMAYPPFAMVDDGFVHCPDTTRLPQAIEQALRQQPADERRLMAYAAATFACSMDCATEILWGQATAQSVADQPQLLARILTELRKIAAQSAKTAGESPQDPRYLRRIG